MRCGILRIPDLRPCFMFNWKFGVYIRWNYCLHLMNSTKFAQAGSIAGYFGSRVYLGINHLRKSQTPIKKGDVSAQQFLETSCRISRNMMLGGFVAAVPIFILHGNSNKVDAEGYFDRAYRIRYNESQCNVDRMSLAMGTLYGSIFAWTNRSFTLGFPKGMCWGVLLAAAYNNYTQATRLKQSMKEHQEDWMTESVCTMINYHEHSRTFCCCT